MKHASAATLEQLAPLLEQLRRVPGLVERKPGIFYYRSSAFLHFHEDPAGVFVDAKLSSNLFERHRVSTSAEQAALLKAVFAAMGSAPAGSRRKSTASSPGA
jgi:hypothetical protein